MRHACFKDKRGKFRRNEKGCCCTEPSTYNSKMWKVEDEMEEVHTVYIYTS